MPIDHGRGQLVTIGLVLVAIVVVVALLFGASVIFN